VARGGKISTVLTFLLFVYVFHFACVTNRRCRHDLLRGSEPSTLQFDMIAALDIDLRGWERKANSASAFAEVAHNDNDGCFKDRTWRMEESNNGSYY
jgi:hypothetical protein